MRYQKWLQLIPSIINLKLLIEGVIYQKKEDCLCNAGQITSITFGNGLTGGGSSGGVTLTVGAGTGVTVNSGDVAIGQAVGTSSDVQFADIDGVEITASKGLYSHKPTCLRAAQ